MSLAIVLMIIICLTAAFCIADMDRSMKRAKDQSKDFILHHNQRTIQKSSVPYMVNHMQLRFTRLLTIVLLFAAMVLMIAGGATTIGFLVVTAIVFIAALASYGSFKHFVKLPNL